MKRLFLCGRIGAAGVVQFHRPVLREILGSPRVLPTPSLDWHVIDCGYLLRDGQGRPVALVRVARGMTWAQAERVAKHLAIYPEYIGAVRGVEDLRVRVQRAAA